MTESNDVKITAAQLATHVTLKTNLVHFGYRVLKLISKEGKIVPFVMNEVQQIVHQAVEHMLAEEGWVRVLIVKGRQQGCSTYVAARYYHKAVSIPGTRIFILSHEASSTKVLFGKVAMYHEFAPDGIKPGTEAQNRTELEFSNHSRYTVGTAGSTNTGRSDTCFLHHYSEPAFYPDPDGVKTGLGQTLPDLPGTEAIWESTCNGYNFWREDVYGALEGQGIYTTEEYYEGGKKKYRLIFHRAGNRGHYRVIFIPWFITPEYTAPVPSNFEPDPDERKLQQTFNLTDGQLVWRRNKIIFFKSVRKFKQEYPCTLAEAFQQSGGTHFSSEAISRAMNSKVQAKHGATVLGVDPSTGKDTSDRTVFCKRKGREVLWVRIYYGLSQLGAAAKIAKLLDDPNEGIDKVFVDWGSGDACIEALRGRGFGEDMVEGVNFGGEADSDLYLNKRAEMAFDARVWLEESGEVKLPNLPEMEVDLLMLPEHIETSVGRKKFPTKAEIKKVTKKSTDILDAFMLTFAYEVRAKEQTVTRTDTYYKQQTVSPLTVRSRISEIMGRRSMR